MKPVTQVRSIVEDYNKKLGQLSEERFSSRPEANKWSKKEELGHLIDSAHSNLRRFIVAQYEMNPKITYEQDVWVKAARYDAQPPQELIELWALLNLQICFVLEEMTAETTERMCDTGKREPELHTLQWLAEDYVKHQLHHLHHILELEAVVY